MSAAVPPDRVLGGEEHALIQVEAIVLRNRYPLSTWQGATRRGATEKLGKRESAVPTSQAAPTELFHVSVMLRVPSKA